MLFANIQNMQVAALQCIQVQNIFIINVAHSPHLFASPAIAAERAVGVLPTVALPTVALPCVFAFTHLSMFTPGGGFLHSPGGGFLHSPGGGFLHSPGRGF